jgi:drug/metabolite transporter (DMT)-like permease
VLAGVIVLDEAFTVWTAVGFVLVVGGSCLVNSRPARDRRSAAEAEPTGQPAAVERG